ncbi:MAG: hypothetical protein KKE31_01490 [Planctomycetes bacterium]|nr:hypothetical protein [Planctomycetota bacterium]MBU1517791.1 hypothetical protein [Planctomycetota bacterium]MBU2457294.1 hypothetical protein [Planctomycetota bacterium]
MANKFVSSAGPKGIGDGSSEQNAWSLQQALNSATAGDYVWIKNDGTYAGTFTVNCSGSYTANTHIFLIGYNDINNCDLVNHISDMDYGQPFWGGPLNPDAENCWVNIDGEGAAGNVVYQNAKHNVHWRNVHFHNSNKQAYNCAYKVSNSQNVSFTKCKFTDGYINLWMDNSSTSCLVEYCYFSDYVVSNLDIGGGSYLNIFSHCVFNGGRAKIYRSVGCNSIFIGGSYAVGAYYYQNVVFNNTMYNQSSYCLAYGHNSYPGGLIEYNNIFIPAAKDIPAIYKNGYGSLAYSGFGCAYCVNDGSVLDNPYSGENGLNVNPQFANAAGNDFRPTNPAVLRGGRPDFAGNPSQIGAILQKYQFIKRWQAANPGRLSIFK